MQCLGPLVKRGLRISLQRYISLFRMSQMIDLCPRIFRKSETSAGGPWETIYLYLPPTPGEIFGLSLGNNLEMLLQLMREDQFCSEVHATFSRPDLQNSGLVTKNRTFPRHCRTRAF